MSRFLQAACKRMVDIVVTAIAFFLLSLCFALIILAVCVTMGWPPFFRQIRPGYQERPFTILKFRAMTNSRDANGRLLPDAHRLTRMGRSLRSTSLDELPELWNVLKGDMSIVGHKPEVGDWRSEDSNQGLEVREGSAA